MTVDLNNLSIEENKLFNDISIDLKEDFHALLDRLYDDIDCNIDWLVNSLFSRCNSFSNIFIDLCYLEFLKRILLMRRIKKVIVCNRSQKSVFKHYCKKNDLDIIIISSESIWKSAINYLIPIKDIMKNFITSVYMITSKDKNRIIKDYNKEGIILLDTFIIPSMVSNGKYIDRYYGDMINYLPNDIKKRCYYTPIFTSGSHIPKFIAPLKATKKQFIFNFDYLKFSDYLYAILSPLRILNNKIGHYYFNGYKITAILKSDIYKNLANPASFQGILNYLFFRRMKLSKVKLKLIIDWFENQVVDRGFNKGKSDYYPSSRSIGYAGYIVSNEFYFHHRPTKAECSYGVIPDKIAVIGSGLQSDIRKYCSSLKVITAPAFRNKIIDFGEKTYLDKIINNVIILAALPVNKDYARDIILMLNEALNYKDNNIEKIIINYHPVLKINEIEYLIKDWDKKYEISSKSFSSLIEKVDIVVSNSSSTCVESIIYSVPVIIVGSRNNVTQNPIPNAIPRYIWELCYSVEQFNLALKKLVLTVDNNRIRKFNKIAMDVQKNYFESVSKDSVMKFLQI